MLDCIGSGWFEAEDCFAVFWTVLEWRELKPRLDGEGLMYRRLALEELASVLGIKKKVLEADIRDLAWLWEMTIEDMDLHNPLGALDVLNAIAKAYIRGRNCRMGSYQTLWKHLPTKAAIIYHLAKYVSEKNAPGGYVWFPHLRDCVVTSVEDFLATAGQMNSERSLRQEEEVKRQREQAKEATEQKARDYMQRLKGQRRYNILYEVRRMMEGGDQP